MAGVSLADIADLMGHADLATTQIYAKVQQEHLRAAVSRLAPLVTADETGMSPENVTYAVGKGGDAPKLLKNGDLEED
jgi:hypothetical protein